VKRLIALMICLVMVTAFAYAEEKAFTLTAPSGAPAIAAAKLAENDPEHFRFIAADTIAAEFSKNEADFIIAPINAGAKLYKAGKSSYILGAVITRGNLVFASQREGFTMDDINGAKITLFGENTINASVALYVLEQKGIVPQNVEYLASAAETQALLMTDAESIVMTAEPAVTAAKIKNEKIASIALTEELNDLTGNTGYAQAGLFIRAETLEKDPEGVREYITLIKNSAEAVTADPDSVVKAAVALEILPNEKVAAAAIPNCGILYTAAADAKDLVEFTANIDLGQFGGSVPADDFYYAEK
jgi:NitT/TauT family transport system substrate-binding protein